MGKSGQPSPTLSVERLTSDGWFGLNCPLIIIKWSCLNCMGNFCSCCPDLHRLDESAFIVRVFESLGWEVVRLPGSHSRHQSHSFKQR